jgi:hypothetical protein
MNVLFLTLILSLVLDTTVLAQRLGSIGLCDPSQDCDIDAHCATGLLCADAHKVELKAKGYDERGANCKNLIGKPWNYEVCFDPKILLPSGGGGGGKTSHNVDSILFARIT